MEASRSLMETSRSEAWVSRKLFFVARALSIRLLAYPCSFYGSRFTLYDRLYLARTTLDLLGITVFLDIFFEAFKGLFPIF